MILMCKFCVKKIYVYVNDFCEGGIMCDIIS